jgi:hypothetical protein
MNLCTLIVTATNNEVLDAGGVTDTAIELPGSNITLDSNTLVSLSGKKKVGPVVPFVTVAASAPFSELVNVKVLALPKLLLIAVKVPAELLKPSAFTLIATVHELVVPPVLTPAPNTILSINSG